MGLDMYLYLEKYESKGSWNKDRVCDYPEELNEFAEEILKRNFMSKQTICQVGYWRKANAIHNWFIENCAGGVDDCKKVYVDYNELEELLNVCEKVDSDNSKASELLPTCNGFFFGGTEYDNWYFENLKYTIELLRKVITFLKDRDDYSVYYEASW